jgi:hypothetical protein
MNEMGTIISIVPIKTMPTFEAEGKQFLAQFLFLKVKRGPFFGTFRLSGYKFFPLKLSYATPKIDHNILILTLK